jgi:biopolymer transport protein ExbB
MKQSLFITLVLIITLAVGIGIWWYVLGNPANFKDGTSREQPINLMGQVFTGGFIVPVLIALTLIDLTIVFERLFSLKKASGKGSTPKFLKEVEGYIEEGNVDAAIQACDNQRGSLANVIRSGLERYKVISHESKMEAEKQLAEVQRAIEEATMLETPVLERNLIVLSTVASIATMFGLLGTVIGMIRAFRAMARAGAPDAIQLAIGISEALVNTAGGLIAAIIGIIFYNYFTNKVDTFTYTIDEASYSMVQMLGLKK